MFIAESPKVIERALDAGYEPVSLLAERKHIEGQARDVIARCGDLPVYTADSSLLEELIGYRLTRGVLCAMGRPKLPEVEELCAGARRVAVLEGTVFRIPWTRIGSDAAEWPRPGMDRLRKLGFKTVAMALCDDSVSIDAPALLVAGDQVRTSKTGRMMRAVAFDMKEAGERNVPVPSHQNA